MFMYVMIYSGITRATVSNAQVQDNKVPETKKLYSPTPVNILLLVFWNFFLNLLLKSYVSLEIYLFLQNYW